MSTEHVSNLTDFKAIIQNPSDPRLVVVDFHASWCGPCHAIAPLYDTLSRRYATRARFLKVDVDQAQDVATFSAVSAMPTFHFYLSAKRVAQFSGADPRRLESTIEQFAPSSAALSFAGQGQRLGSDAPSTSSRPSSSSSSLRDAAAAAAAKRLQPPAESTLQSENHPQSENHQSVGKSPATDNDARLKVDQTMLKQMINEMGFPKLRAEKSLILTANKSLEAAVDWCFEHADDPDIDQPLQIVTPEGAPKPKLSAEEAKKKADQLFARARAKREAEEKRQAIDREKSRIKSGKEVTSARSKLEEEARKRAVEDRRKQKREEMAERQRVRDMLEADKERRRQRFNMPASNPPASNPLQPAPPAAPSPAHTPSVPASAAGKIQLRLPDGARVEGEFRADQTMSDLVSFLVSRKPELGSRAITFSQQYPRRMYSQADFQTSLSDLGLLPRGALSVLIS